MLNVEIVEKRNLDRTARKNDARLLNVQKLITTATATLVNASDQLHRVTTALADQSTRGGEQPNPSRFVEAANEMLASNGDVIALLGTAQQELSLADDTSCNRHYRKTRHHCVALKTSQLLTSFSVMVPIKQSKQPERLQNQELPFRRPAAPPLQTRTKQAFFKTVQSAGELQQPQGARKTLEPERGRKVQGEITESKKSER